MRRQGLIPAVIYGRNTETIMLSIINRDLEDIARKENLGQVLLNLTIENGKKTNRPAMIKELQVHPVSGKYLHVDFYEIDLQRKILVNIPVVTTGQSKGVEAGGTLQLVRRELEVYCLPTEIPESIEIDISELDIGDAVHVEEIPLARGIEIPAETNFTVLTITSPMAEEVVEEEEEEEEEGEEAAAEEESGEEPEEAE